MSIRVLDLAPSIGLGDSRASPEKRVVERKWMSGSPVEAARPGRSFSPQTKLHRSNHNS